MLIPMPVMFPFGSAYLNQRLEFDAALDYAIEDAAKKVGRDGVRAMFEKHQHQEFLKKVA